MKMRVLIEFEFPDERLRTPRDRLDWHQRVVAVIEKHQFAIPGTLVYLQTDRLAMSSTKNWQNFNGK